MHHAREAAVDVGDDVDDAPALARDHRLVGDLAGHVPGAEEVVLHDRGEAVGRDVLRRRRELTAGVVDQHVDAAEPLDHAGDQLGHVVDLADLDVVGQEGYELFPRRAPPPTAWAN